MLNERMHALYIAGVPHSSIAVQANDNLANVINGISAFKKAQNKRPNVVTRMVTVNAGSSYWCLPTAVSMPRVSIIDGVAA